MPAALHTLRMATRCTPDRSTTFSAAARIAAIVASERRLRLRRRTVCGAGPGAATGAGAEARWRASRASAELLPGSTEDLDPARFFFLITGVFMFFDSGRMRGDMACFPAEILQYFAVEVQLRPDSLKCLLKTF
jgi:hypothetical protein